MPVMHNVKTALHDIITTGIRLPFGMGVIGPSGIGGPTFTRYVKEIRQFVERLASRAIGPTAAEDIGQDVFVAVCEIWEKNHTFLNGSKPVYPILYTIAQRKISNHRRGEGRQRVRDSHHMAERVASVHTWMDPEASLQETEMEAVRERSLKRMSRAVRKVFELKEEGVRYREIARRLGKSESRVKKDVAKGVAIFRDECFAAGLPMRLPARRVNHADLAGPGKMKRVRDGGRRDDEGRDDERRDGERRDDHHGDGDQRDNLSAGGAR